MPHQDDLPPSDIFLFLLVLHSRVNAVGRLRVLPVHVVLGMLASCTLRAPARAGSAPDKVKDTAVSRFIVLRSRELLESRGFQVALPHLLRM